MHTKRASVFGSTMTYYECGQGSPIVFLHGNPTSKYLWRNVMPHLESLGRCIAPDLIGMGESDKLNDSNEHRYSFIEHYRYLREFLYQVGATEDIALVIHDWGSVLGFHWAAEHMSAVRGICFMESIVKPVEWEDWPEASVRIFQGFRSEAGESMVIERNMFVERVLRGSLLKPIDSDDMAVYLEPFKEANEDRRPTLSWPRQIPIAGEPQNVVDIVQKYGECLSVWNVPKLFINADPGAILIGKQREYCRSWPNVTEVSVTAGHFVPEDAAPDIALNIKVWLTSQLACH